ncbi:hypothetical protein BDA96_07G233700 [Sorghum bicolor]|uniref:Uncharacterized protein n=2 Tax=Sorghum bicolor TaxID=4558 RepID=A0A921UAD0_SORBI|nr:hypothetical protein BDA96_07G233700 [Sorghum bicolor]KXG25697.1 hypothetical protein SORBI_3007G219700 [Sorghum bicolor]
MAISSKTVAAVLITMMLLSTTPAATMSTHHYPCTGRRVLQVPAAAATNKDTDSFPPSTPGHSPSGGHGSSPPMTK